MVRCIGQRIQFAPLISLCVPLCAPHQLSDSLKFNLQFPEPSLISQMPDKLRWYRYREGLLQRDVADYLKINRTTYHHYESCEMDSYPIEHLQALADLYKVSITDLMDDYHVFLYNGQGQQIRQIRNRLHLTQQAYAERLGVHLCNLKRWEQNAVRISRQTWEKHFRE